MFLNLTRGLKLEKTKKHLSIDAAMNFFILKKIYILKSQLNRPNLQSGVSVAVSGELTNGAQVITHQCCLTCFTLTLPTELQPG